MVVVNRDADVDLENNIKSQAGATASACCTVIGRRRFETFLLCMTVVLVLNFEIEAGGASLARWVELGAMVTLIGCLTGLLAGLCSGGHGQVSRVQGGSFSNDCCATFCSDVWRALCALVLSLVATCFVAALLNGSLAMLLVGARHVEHAFGVDADGNYIVDFPEWLRADLMWLITGLLGVWALVRFFFKTKHGWWRSGDMLTDDTDDNDWAALL